MITVYEERGIEIGLQKGLQEGLQKGKKEVAIQALKNGLDISMVAIITGFSHSEIEKLQK